MSVWVKARKLPFKMRDGTDRDDPMRAIGDEPVRFEKLTADDFAGNTWAEIVPPKRGRPRKGKVD